MITRVWQHTYTGDKMLVAVDSYGAIVGALALEDVADLDSALNGSWSSTARDTTTVKGQQNMFRDITHWFSARKSFEDER